MRTKIGMWLVVLCVFAAVIVGCGEDRDRIVADNSQGSDNPGIVGPGVTEEPTDEAGGAGLGLYVSRKYLNLHQGKIWAESPGKGRGSTFYVELPIA